MAVNVNTVYKTVLLITNKEQRGYLTPTEFNSLANQVQLEIIDGYFETINQQTRVLQNETEYANRLKNAQEQLDIFKTIGTCTYTAPTTTSPGFFDVPASSGTPSAVQNFSTVGTQSTYALTTITQAQVDTSTVIVTYLGAVYSSQNYSITGGQLILLNGNLPTGNPNNLVITLYPNDFYKLGTVLYRDDREVEQIQRNELAMLNLSPISKPTDYFPVYLYENKRITIYPQTINSNVQATYLRKPADVMWNFTSANGYYEYDSTGSVDFELDDTEQTNIILRILFYAGVVIEDRTVIEVAAGEVAKEEQNKRS